MNLKMLRNGIFCLFVLFLFSLMSCAQKRIVEFDMNELGRIQNKTVGLLVLSPNTELEVSRSDYKVFFYDMSEAQFSFEGMWDPTIELNKLARTSFGENFNVNVKLLQDVVDAQAFDEIKSLEETVFNVSRVKFGPDSSSFQSSLSNEFGRARTTYASTYLSKKVEKVLLDKAKENNLDYILEIPFLGVSVYTHAFMFTNLRVFSFARLIRVSDGEVIWADQGKGYVKMKEKMDDPSILFKNDFKLLEGYFNEAIKGLLIKDYDCSGMSMVYESYLFESLDKSLTE